MSPKRSLKLYPPNRKQMMNFFEEIPNQLHLVQSKGMFFALINLGIVCYSLSSVKQASKSGKYHFVEGVMLTAVVTLSSLAAATPLLTHYPFDGVVYHWRVLRETEPNDAYLVVVVYAWLILSIFMMLYLLLVGNLSRQIHKKIYG